MTEARMLQFLKGFNLVYPQAQRSEKELKVLATVWTSDLSAYSDRAISVAIDRHRKASPFFPTIADIIRHCEEYEKEQSAERMKLALPEVVPTSPERSKWWCQKILELCRS